MNYFDPTLRRSSRNLLVSTRTNDKSSLRSISFDRRLFFNISKGDDSIVIQVTRRTEVKGCRSSTPPFVALPGYQGTVYLKCPLQQNQRNLFNKRFIIVSRFIGVLDAKSGKGVVNYVPHLQIRNVSLCD